MVADGKAYDYACLVKARVRSAYGALLDEPPLSKLKYIVYDGIVKNKQLHAAD